MMLHLFLAGYVAGLADRDYWRDREPSNYGRFIDAFWAGYDQGEAHRIKSQNEKAQRA